MSNALSNMCCCLSVRTGSILAAWLSILLFISFIGVEATVQTQLHGARIFGISIGFFSSIALLFGIHERRPRLFLPYLICKILTLIGMVALFVYMGSTELRSDYPDDSEWGREHRLLHVVLVKYGTYIWPLLLAIFVLKIYLYLVVLGHYKELKSEDTLLPYSNMADPRYQMPEYPLKVKGIM